MWQWLRFFLWVSVLAGAAAMWLAQSQYETQLRAQGLEHQRQNTVAALLVGNQIGQRLSQLARLRNDPRVAQALTRDQARLDELASLFRTLLSLDPTLQQARWIDGEGLERVRVEQSASGPSVVAEELLQNKSDRDYFLAMQQVPDNSLWMSTIDLNEENGQVERPLRPTIRMATQVPGSRLDGFLILNYDAQPIIGQIRSSGSVPEWVGFLDSQGQWIVGANGADEFAQQLSREESVGPALLEQIQGQASGSQRFQKGLVSWVQLSLTDLPKQLVQPKLYILTYWPADEVAPLVWRYRLLALGILLLILAPSGYLTRRWFNAQRAEKLAVERQLQSQRESNLALKAQAERLERSNRDLDAFAYAAAHDLRTPLRSLGQYSGLLIEELTDLTDEHRGYVNRIGELSQSLDRMLKGLLQYSRVGRVEGESATLDLYALIPKAAAPYLESGFECHVNTRDQVFAPEPLVEMIVRNLAMNAVKHHHRSEGRLEFSSYRDGDQVVLLCQDDGPGIPQTHWQQVFSVFAKLQSGKLSQQDGLGLAMVRRAAESLGGSAWIESSSEKGTCFAISLPAAK